VLQRATQALLGADEIVAVDDDVHFSTKSARHARELFTIAVFVAVVKDLKNR
jgi:hypothetical protein